MEGALYKTLKMQRNKLRVRARGRSCVSRAACRAAGSVDRAINPVTCIIFTLILSCNRTPSGISDVIGSEVLLPFLYKFVRLLILALAVTNPF